MIQQFIEKVRGRSLSVVLPEGKDERIIAAARRLKDENTAEPMVLGRRAEVEAAAANADARLDGIRIVAPVERDIVAAAPTCLVQSLYGTAPV